jgi:hypothetical protein
MNSWKIILAAVVIFCAGIITGSLLMNQVPGKRIGEALAAETEPNPRPTGEFRGPGGRPAVPLPRLAERLSKEFVRRLDQELHLTVEQSNHIARVVAEGQERNRVLWTNVAPHMRKVMQEVRQQIRAELTPEQLARFEELMKPPPRKSPPTNRPPRQVEATNLPPVGPAHPPPGG